MAQHVGECWGRLWGLGHPVGLRVRYEERTLLVSLLTSPGGRYRKCFTHLNVDLPKGGPLALARSPKRPPDKLYFEPPSLWP